MDSPAYLLASSNVALLQKSCRLHQENATSYSTVYGDRVLHVLETLEPEFNVLFKIRLRRTVWVQTFNLDVVANEYLDWFKRNCRFPYQSRGRTGNSLR